MAPASLVGGLQERALYGGAMVAHLPGGWLDASDARPVPDNQEVWLERDGYERSVIVELLERAECSDEASGAYHFEEVANGNEAVSSTVFSSAVVPAAQLRPQLCSPFAALVHGVQQLQRDGLNGGQLLPAGVTAMLQVHMVLIRLRAQNTDVLITLNRQMPRSDASVAGQPTPDNIGEQEDLALLTSIACTLEVRDWSLFGA